MFRIQFRFGMLNVLENFGIKTSKAIELNEMNKTLCLFKLLEKPRSRANHK